MGRKSTDSPGLVRVDRVVLLYEPEASATDKQYSEQEIPLGENYPPEIAADSLEMPLEFGLRGYNNPTHAESNLKGYLW